MDLAAFILYNPVTGSPQDIPTGAGKYAYFPVTVWWEDTAIILMRLLIVFNYKSMT